MSIKLILGTGLLLLAAGCGLHWNEPSPQPNTISYSGKGFNCVGQIPQHLDLYLSDALSETQIDDFMGCLEKAFVTFGQLTRGRDQNNYAPDEIRRFLESYFFKERKISDRFLAEFMVVKQVILGGSLNQVSRQELVTFIAILEDIRKQAQFMKPHLKYLSSKFAGQLAASGETANDFSQRLLAANAAFRKTIGVFTDRLQNSKHAYAFANMEAFVTEFRAFVGWEQHFKNAHATREWVDFLRLFKEIAVSREQPEVVRESEWAPMLQSMVRYYTSFIEFEVGVKNRVIFQNAGFRNTLVMANEIFALLKDAVDLQPKQTLTFAQLHRIMASLKDLGWLPERLRVHSLAQFAQVLTTRIFGEREAGGLSRFVLANLESEFYRWAHVQMDIEERFPPPPSPQPAVPELRPNLGAYANKSVARRTSAREISGSDWDEFMRVRTLMRPLYLDTPRVHLMTERFLRESNVRFGFYNYSMMNVMRSVITLLFRGYAHDRGGNSLWDGKINIAELQKFYQDIREIGIDLGYIDQRNLNAGSRAFIEGKLFTYSARGLISGDEQMSFVEMVEYLAFLYSGSEIGDDIYHELSAHCKTGPVDLKGNVMVSRSCAELQMPDLIEHYTVNMPELNRFLHGASPEVRSGYARAVLGAAFTAASTPEWVERSEITTVTVMIHYAEAIMTRFDTDNDGVLTNDEINAAVPIFSGFIKKIAKEKQNRSLEDSEARAAFLFILDEKRMPSSNWDYFKVYWNSKREPTLALNRYDLSQVFKAIIAKLSEVGTGSTAPVVPAVEPDLPDCFSGAEIPSVIGCR